MKKYLSILLALALVLSFAACGEKTAPSEPAVDVEFTVAMVTDVGGVNDQAFNQSAWEGLQSLESKGYKISYVESASESDYTTNLDQLTDETPNLIWGVGYMLADAIKDAAARNPEQLYAIVDNAYEETPENVVCAVFKAEEPSFLVGYVAGQMTKTNKVGFIGGMESETIKTFETGYRAGVAQAANERGVEITVDVQYANSFGDAAIGKAIALVQYDNGCDIIFHAAGGVGNGVIEAAVERDLYAIGVDRDQNYLAPDHVITSAMKKVGEAMAQVTEKVQAGEVKGGETFVFGLKEGAAGLAPTSDKLVPAEVLAGAQALEAKVVAGEIVVPADEAALEAFIAALPEVAPTSAEGEEVPLDGEETPVDAETEAPVEGEPVLEPAEGEEVSKPAVG